MLGRHAAAADAGSGPVRRAFARIANALGARVGRSGPGATRAESAARSGISLPNVGETLVSSSKAHVGTIAYGCGTDTTKTAGTYFSEHDPALSEADPTCR